MPISGEISSPFPIFYGLDGKPLDAGYIYIGLDNLDPETNPINVFWDESLTISAQQPLRTQSGWVIRSGSVAPFFSGYTKYSITVKDSRGQIVVSRLSSSSKELLALYELADHSDISKGDALVAVKQPYDGSIERTEHDKNIDYVSIFDFIDETNKSYIISDNIGAQDAGIVTYALNKAATELKAAGRGLLLEDGIYKTNATWVIPAGLHVKSRSKGWPVSAYNPTVRVSGAIIYKAHNGNAITSIGSVPYQDGAPIDGICVISNYNTWPTGDGIVLDKLSNAHVKDCSFWSLGGVGLRLGVSAGDVTGQNYAYTLYANNCLGGGYYIRSKWFRGHHILSDAGQWGIVMDDAPEGYLDGCHFEGPSVGGVYFKNACQNTLVNKSFISLTNVNATIGVKTDNVAGNDKIKLRSCRIYGPNISLTFTGALSGATSGTLTAAFTGPTGTYSLVFSDGSYRSSTLTNGSTSVSWTGAVTATALFTAYRSDSIGVSIAGSSVQSTLVDDCHLAFWDIGVKDDGSASTRLVLNAFENCRLPIYCNSAGVRYETNFFTGSFGGYCIDHIGYTSGRVGIWTGNTFDKPLKPTYSGVNGDFGNNQVYNNSGIKTSYKAVSGSSASPITLPHGMTGNPASFGASVVSGTYANLTVGCDATNVTVTWTGGGSCQVSVWASLACENKL